MTYDHLPRIHGLGEAVRLPVGRAKVRDSTVTKIQLGAEVKRLRQRVAELETAEFERRLRNLEHSEAEFRELNVEVTFVEKCEGRIEGDLGRERRRATSHGIVLADAHELVRHGIRALLEKQPDLTVIGEAGNGPEAFLSAHELRPELVVMDVEMPGLNGIDTARRIVSEIDGVAVLCLSMHSSSRFVEAAFEAGAAGYLLKDSPEEEFVRAVHTVLSGHTYASPAISDAMVGALRQNDPPEGASAFTLLTGREREVLQLSAEGCSTREIASNLYISPKTVYTHRQHLMEKLDIHSVAGLTRYAIREGLTSSEQVRSAGVASEFF